MRIQNFTFESGAYRQSAKVTLLGHTFEVSSGNNDDVFVYADKESIYVLSINYHFGYVGLEIFDREDGKTIGDFFVQDADQDESFAWILDSKRMPTVIRYLSNYIY